MDLSFLGAMMPLASKEMTLPFHLRVTMNEFTQFLSKTSLLPPNLEALQLP
jgi:hypothetical protein